MNKKMRHSWWLTCFLLAGLVLFFPAGSLAKKISLPETYQTITDKWAPGLLEIKFFNVGKGDAILLRLPDGGFVMIDTGYAETAPTLIKELNSLGVGKIDLLVLTHHDKDHAGGFPYLLEAFPVERVVQSYDPREPLKNLIKPGTKILSSGGVTITAIGPDKPHEDENDASLVARLEFGRIVVLFAADAIEASISELLKNKKKLRADILKVPHHGRYKGFSPRDFFAAVKPEYAVITSDEKAGDPPEDSTVRILKEFGARVLLTDEIGNIQFLSDGETIDYISGGNK